MGDNYEKSSRHGFLARHRRGGGPALAAAGWRVTINYLTSREKAEALAAELGTEALRADVADPAQVRAMFEAAGPFDLLVCNAGVAWTGLLRT